MNRCGRALVCVVFLVAPTLSVGWFSTQDKILRGTGDKDPGRGIAFTDPAPGDTKTPVNPFITKGTNSDKNAVYGLLFDPDAPDTPIPGETQPAPNDGTGGTWQINFNFMPNTNNGWLLRVIDNNTGNSQDCVFNIQNGVGPPVVLPLTPQDIQEVQVTETITKGLKTTTAVFYYLRFSATVKASKPKLVHAEAYYTDIDNKGKIVVGDVQLTHTGGITTARVNIDVTGFKSGTVYTVGVNSFLPHGHAQAKVTKK
jgi:hypothetical protein